MSRENLPHATVATVVEKDGRFLLVKEFRSGRWVYNQPAGHIESGEGIEAAAIRETLEETGWTVQPKAVAGISVYHAANGISYIRTTLIATPLSHDPTLTLDDGIEEAVWLTFDELLKLKDQLRSPIVLKVVEDVRNGISLPLDMIYEHR